MLWLDGRDLRGVRLLERKRVLRGIVPAGPCLVLYVDHVADRGVDLFQAVCEHDLEGIVAKRADELYTPEETTWVKIKNPRYSQADSIGGGGRRRRAAVSQNDSTDSTRSCE